jgi:P-type Cu2+ transporter
LAVPAVQVIATGRLMRRGILLKSGTALERLATADTVVFDKTGTLTLGKPALANAEAIDPEALRLAAGMARSSAHPLARALAQAVQLAPVVEGTREIAGCGLSLPRPEGEIRLGSRAWCGIDEDVDAAEAEAGAGMELWLARPGHAAVRFAFADAPRPDAAAVIAALKQRGYGVTLISGDRAPAVHNVATALGIGDWHARVTPAGKTAFLSMLAREGRRALMVGDGLNDAPALAAAHVSISPSSAADISQTAADAVFQGEKLGAVIELIDTAAASRRLVRQNIAASIAYNFVAVPVAILGLLTPFLAAIAMSGSSLAVVGNALRLARRRTQWT